MAFSIGLTFSLARHRVGMWVLVLVHCLIDLFSDLLVRDWKAHETLGRIVIGVYCAGALLFLALRKPEPTQP